VRNSSPTKTNLNELSKSCEKVHHTRNKTISQISIPKPLNMITPFLSEPDLIKDSSQTRFNLKEVQSNKEIYNIKL